MLPNFLVIGAAKCGTTSLCELLGQHPQVFMARPKEIHFFGRNDPSKTLEWYEAFFRVTVGKKAVGEGSTSYTHPDIIEACAAEIAQRIPHCRLIYMVRNPLDRLESDWKMRRHEGWAPGSINEAVTQQASLVTHGLYWKNLSVYRRHFSDEQILIVFLEDFARNPNDELRRCFEHIGVDPSIGLEDADEPRNAASSYRLDGLIARWLRHSPVLKALKRYLPHWAILGAKFALTKRADYVVDWDPEVRQRVTYQFLQDSKLVLQFCGKDPDLWGLQARDADAYSLQYRP